MAKLSFEERRERLLAQQQAVMDEQASAIEPFVKRKRAIQRELDMLETQRQAEQLFAQVPAAQRKAVIASLKGDD